MPSTIFLPLDSRDRKSGTPYNCTIQLPQAIRKGMRRISLLSLELPWTFYNIRAPYNQMTIVSTTVTITPGEYGIDDLLSILTTAFGGKYTFTWDQITSKVTIARDTNVTLTSPLIVTKAPWCIAQMLGFTNGQTGTSITGTSVYNLAYDLHLNMLITNISTNTLSPIPTTFRIPLNTSSGTVFYLWQNNSFKQHVDVDEQESLTYLKILFQDRFGNVPDANGTDWSALLKIEID
jgi:hypothetical protein